MERKGRLKKSESGSRFRRWKTWEVRRDESRVWLDMWAMVLEKGNMEEGAEEGSSLVVVSLDRWVGRRR